jgi:hypothetical protein
LKYGNFNGKNRKNIAAAVPIVRVRIGLSRRIPVCNLNELSTVKTMEKRNNAAEIPKNNAYIKCNLLKVQYFKNILPQLTVGVNDLKKLL